MSVAELKEQIATRLSQVNDEDLLREVADMLQKPAVSNDEPVFEFSDEAWEEIMEAVREDDEGKTLTHEEVTSEAWQIITDFEKKQASE